MARHSPGLRKFPIIANSSSNGNYIFIHKSSRILFALFILDFAKNIPINISITASALMSENLPLRGGCSCGRNQYVIHPSISQEDSLQVLLEDKADQGKPVARFNYKLLMPTFNNAGRVLSLRVPLSRLRSTTYAFYPDETHHAIRRVFTPRNAPHSKRYFCGFCGTQLTYWSEESREEADWVCVSVGSLRGESLEILEEAGHFAGAGEKGRGATGEDKELDKGTAKRKHTRELSGTPWFEEMIEGSELGKLKRRRGWQESPDGKTQIEWEVVEFTAEDEAATSVDGGKHRIEVGGDGDAMKVDG